jgi:hypothetical protein
MSSAHYYRTNYNSFEEERKKEHFMGIKLRLATRTFTTHWEAHEL